VTGGLQLLFQKGQIKLSKTEVVKRLQIMAPMDHKPKKGSSVVNITNADQFRRLAADPRLTVVHFWTSWANQVRMKLVLRVVANSYC